MNLKDVLADDDLMLEFNEHLRSEFSVENMLFFNRAKAFALQHTAGTLKGLYGGRGSFVRM